MSAELKFCNTCDEETSPLSEDENHCSLCKSNYDDYREYCPDCGEITVFDSWDDTCKECGYENI